MISDCAHVAVINAVNLYLLTAMPNMIHELAVKIGFSDVLSIALGISVLDTEFLPMWSPIIGHHCVTLFLNTKYVTDEL